VAKLRSRSAALLAFVSIAGAVRAQSDNPWAGFYAGLNAGGAWSDTCNSATLNGAMIEPGIAAAFYNRNCPGGTFVGGVQLGDNFQYKRLVWGIGADLDAWSAKNRSRSLKYTGEVPPPGTYAFSGKLSPNDFIVIGPRFGYAGDLWLPYLRVGTIITTGSRDSTLSYIPAGATKPTASFSGGKNFTSTGWVAGAGTEIGLNGAWSITAEYLHVNLGKGSNSTTTCNGSASACAAFSGISLHSMHNGFTANVFRVGINYWFGYWEP
jgi:outer membrane immunogenic protein